MSIFPLSVVMTQIKYSSYPLGKEALRDGSEANTKSSIQSSFSGSLPAFDVVTVTVVYFVANSLYCAIASLRTLAGKWQKKSLKKSPF